MNGSGDRISPSDGQEPMGPVAVSLTLLTTALWGGTTVAVSYSVDELPPVAVSGIRFALAAVFMLWWCRLHRSPLRLMREQWRPTIIMGVLLFVQITLFTVAIAWSSSSHSTILINTFVFWVAGIEHFVTRTLRLDAMKILGLLLAAAGGLTVLGIVDATPSPHERDPATLAGDLIMLASAFVLGIKMVYTKVAARVVPPASLIFWHDVIGVVLFACWSLAFEEIPTSRVHAPTVLALLYQGVVVAGFCFALQAHLLARHSASKISIYSVASPLFGVLAAWALRGDPLSPWLIVSTVCVAAGILIVNLESTSRRPG